LEGTYSDDLVQLPDHLRADWKLKHVIKGIVQMPFKHWQALGIDHLSRKPVPGFDRPLCKEMLLNVQSEPPWAQLWTIPTRPIAGSQGEELSTSPSACPPQEAVESNDVHRLPGTGLPGVDQAAHAVLFSVSITVNVRGIWACCHPPLTSSGPVPAPFKANNRRHTSHLLSEVLYMVLYMWRAWVPLTFRYKYLLQSPALCFVSVKFLRVPHKAVYGWTIFWHIS